MNVDINCGKSFTGNSLLNHANKKAAYKQTDIEHAEALNKYIRPGQSIPERELAIKLGIEEEKSLPQYWDDEKPRREINASSSFIDNIEVIPSLHLVRVTMNNGKKSYMKEIPMSTNEAGDMITSPSIGKTFNQKIRGK